MIFSYQIIFRLKNSYIFKIVIISHTYIYIYTYIGTDTLVEIEA